MVPSTCYAAKLPLTSARPRGQWSRCWWPLWKPTDSAQGAHQLRKEAGQPVTTSAATSLPAYEGSWCAWGAPEAGGSHGQARRRQSGYLLDERHFVAFRPNAFGSATLPVAANWAGLGYGCFSSTPFLDDHGMVRVANIMRTQDGARPLEMARWQHGAHPDGPGGLPDAGR